MIDCWDKLAATPSRVPEMAIQPAGFSMKLLPFQREGLNWMMKQEEGPWKGGMLADEMVSKYQLLEEKIELIFGFREWEKLLRRLL